MQVREKASCVFTSYCAISLNSIVKIISILIRRMDSRFNLFSRDNIFVCTNTMSTLWKPWQPLTTESTAPAIMKSLDNSLDDFDKLPEFNPKLFLVDKNPLMSSCTMCRNNNDKSFLLLDGYENLQVSDAEEFLKKLNCVKENTKVKVVSIFGKTGDGKSYSMNQVFFKGEEVFQTSNEQDCCTLGVWAAFDPILNVICLDTEGIYILCIIIQA